MLVTLRETRLQRLVNAHQSMIQRSVLEVKRKLLRSLDDLGRGHFQFGVEHPIPETASDTKSVLVVGKVMLEMVLLESAVPGRETMTCQNETLSCKIALYTHLRWCRK
jgi:hypothetical protein